MVVGEGGSEGVESALVGLSKRAVDDASDGANVVNGVLASLLAELVTQSEMVEVELGADKLDLVELVSQLEGGLVDDSVKRCPDLWSAAA